MPIQKLASLSKCANFAINNGNAFQVTVMGQESLTASAITGASEVLSCVLMDVLWSGRNVRYCRQGHLVSIHNARRQISCPCRASCGIDLWKMFQRRRQCFRAILKQDESIVAFAEKVSAALPSSGFSECKYNEIDGHLVQGILTRTMAISDA